MLLMESYSIEKQLDLSKRSMKPKQTVQVTMSLVRRPAWISATRIPCVRPVSVLRW